MSGTCIAALGICSAACHQDLCALCVALRRTRATIAESWSAMLTFHVVRASIQCLLVRTTRRSGCLRDTASAASAAGCAREDGLAASGAMIASYADEPPLL